MPIKLKGTIEAIKHGDRHAETEVVVKVGSVHVIVTKKRKPYHHESDFTNLGLKPREADIVVVLSDIMALTKLNYNTCIYSDGPPVTLKFADAVGEILTAGPLETVPPLSFKFYI